MAAEPAEPAAGGRAAPTQLDAMLVTGTRASNRTQFDTMAPVDVFTKEDIKSVESTDLKDVLAQLVPSFVVQRLPMADGQVFVRPATLRGLSPDQTLVLVNGRRFHRSALLGNRGAQAADLAQIPTSAIKRIEVLRDGASAQYGSDAIAGVINIILEDDPGTEITAGYSQYAQGDGASRDFSARTGWALGDYGSLAVFAESSNSNGAPGFPASQAGQWDQRSKAAYVDVEVSLGNRWTIAAAGRYEDFSSFGSTLGGKFSARFEITPDVAMRGTFSTGFRAPTPAQLSTTSTTQGLDTRTLQIFTSGRLSPNDPLAQLLGAKPLKPEESRTASLGLTWRTDMGLSGSVDLHRISLTDRFSQSASFAIPAGTPNPLGYTSVNYFTNNFDTTATGVDIVGNYLRELGKGRMTLTLAYNFNRTRVDNGSTSVATNETQRILFEDRLPEHKGSFTGNWETGPWSFMARVRYYGAWTDSTGNAVGDIYQRFGEMTFLDLAASYRFNEHHSLRVGADNVFDSYPDEATFQASRGLIYSRNAPYDTDGGNIYAQYRFTY
ncbi:MAG: Vitamin B12 transporter BtuB [Stenotrophomonas maltophilia]|uniref:Vitamin B12 transporter BtuB n=1 Tax=Stenotrophomonas maltophilia TaxID=40324 RepID=A0A7V8JLW2_STEMA|nr:MAG: Vitamin B12 transporter BtuB [Stenotrophomonas maltophilia]